MFFEGDQSALNPMRYLPTPFHTKFAQQRSPLSQYIQQEAGAIGRVTGTEVIPYEVEHRSSRAEATWEKWAAS
jgi:hypothetical protein